MLSSIPQETFNILVSHPAQKGKIVPLQNPLESLRMEFVAKSVAVSEENQ